METLRDSREWQRVPQNRNCDINISSWNAELLDDISVRRDYNLSINEDARANTMFS